MNGKTFSLATEPRGKFGRKKEVRYQKSDVRKSKTFFKPQINADFADKS